MQFEKVISYDPLTGLFHRLKNKAVIGTLNSKGYLQIFVFGKRWNAHRLAWYMSYGRWPEGQIDHINHVRTDNRLSNLRDVSANENNENRIPFDYPPKPVGVTGMKGVTPSGRGDFIVRRWDKIQRKQIYIGRATTLEEANRMTGLTCHV